MTATEVAKARRCSIPHRRVRAGTSTEPPPPPKKPLASPAAAPASRYRVFWDKRRKPPPFRLSVPEKGAVYVYLQPTM